MDTDTITAILPSVISRDEAIRSGLKRYFTGKPCIHGHISERICANKTCYECVRLSDIARSRIRYQEFRVKNPIQTKEKREVSPQEMRERRRRYYLNYKKKNLELIKNAYKQRDKNKEKERLKRYVAENKDVVRGRKRKWKKDNPEAVLCHTRNRRAKKKSAIGSHTPKDISSILDLQKGRCAICKTKVLDGYHVDHIVPLARGGSNDRRNLQVTCGACNMRKSDRDPIDHMRSLGFLI